MKLELWMLGETAFDYLKTGMSLYEKRLKAMMSFEAIVLPGPKATKHKTEEQIKLEEGEIVLKRLQEADRLILFDERGLSLSSTAWATWLDKQFQAGGRGKLILLIGGAYGFSPAIYARAQAQISLSPMTFSHQMIRLFALEQCYRAMSILRNLPYHHA